MIQADQGRERFVVKLFHSFFCIHCISCCEKKNVRSKVIEFNFGESVVNLVFFCFSVQDFLSYTCVYLFSQ